MHTHTHTHTHKLKFKGQSVQKIKWKNGRTDRRTDGQMDSTDYFTFPANAVGKQFAPYDHWQVAHSSHI